MRHILTTLALCLVLAIPAKAQQQAITDVITRQIEALKADDFEAAFAFASPTIKQIFRTPENFGAMVQRGYPMVWRPADLRYLQLREVAGNLWQRVQITDAQGRVHLLDYQMIETPGGWQINAVQLLKAPGATA